MDALISLNFGISLILVLISLQAYTNLKLLQFKYIFLAAIFNSALLILKISNEFNYNSIEYFYDFFNILSSYYFLITFFVSKKIKEVYYHFTGISVGLLASLATNQLTDKSKEYVFLILSVFSVFWLYKYLLKFRKELYRKYSANMYLSNSLLISIYGVSLYGIVHFIPLSLSLIGKETNFIGYLGGIIAKLLLITGFYRLIIGFMKIKADNVLFAEELNKIIGLLFHELGPVNNSLYSEIEDLQNNQEKYKLNKSSRRQIKEIEFTANRLNAIYHSNYDRYLNEDFDIDWKIDQDTLPHNKSEKEVISINSAIESAHGAFKTADFVIQNSKLKYDEFVQFTFQYGKRCFIKGHESRLTQVFLNLFKNSFEAFPNKRGKIFIKTKYTKEIDINNNPIDLVVIEVEDNGIGVPEDMKHKLFEEGASSKQKNDKIKGYGLSQIKQIVHNEMNGIINYESPVTNSHFKESTNPGTRFTIKFRWVEIKK